jgi:DNA-binding CsgD family transcriptional regulator
VADDGRREQSVAEEREFRLEQLRRLTGRELEVLQWRASGRTIPELAADLNVTERTAHFHLGNIYAKLDLASRSQGQRQIELAAYGRLLAESGVGASGESPATSYDDSVDEPPGGAVLAVLEDEAVAGARAGTGAGVGGGTAAGAGGGAAPPAREPVPGAPTEGERELTLEALIELKQQNVTPAYIAELAAEGHSRLSPDTLIELRQQGISGAFIRELRDAGYEHFSPDDLVEARQQGISGAFIRELHEAGLTGLSLDDLVEARQQGVNGEYVRSVAGAGLAGLALGQLVHLRQQGVDADSLAELRLAMRGADRAG